MAIRRKTNKKAFAEINITPFTDVVLVLLIIFMISAPILIRNDIIQVNLPNAEKTAMMQDTPDKVSINITSNDDIYIENTKFSMAADNAEIKARLEELKKKNNKISIFINGDKTCRYESIMKIIDIANQIGIRQINMGVKLQGR